MSRSVLIAVAVLVWVVAGTSAAAPPPVVHAGQGGRLEYATDARGNRVPDFSHAGYGGGAAMPTVPVRVVVPPVVGDNGPRIQAAIDHVSQLPADKSGCRGAVLLAAGRYEVHGQLKLASGVVLRGQGTDTVLVAAGTDRRALIVIRGTADQSPEAKVRFVTDSYVPVNAVELRVDSAQGMKAGDAVTVEHPSTKEWIAAVGMDRFPTRDKGSYLDWKPGTVNLVWERTVTAVDGSTITLDAPLTSALDATLTRATVRRNSRAGRMRQAGVEHLRCESTFDKTRPLDEDHAWTGVSVENAEDVWVRQVSFRHFAGSAVCVWETARRVTVSDCDSADPVSEVGGFRRHTFFTAGQQCLFLRCKAASGRHDFAPGHLATGPTAFVHCTATNATRFSGPIGCWASGVLYDNVTIDGGGLMLTNRESEDQGVGWAAANSVLWQCVAPAVVCRMPPTAQNWAIGVWGHFTGDGHWRQLNEFAKPDSLHAAQWHDRLGNAAGLKRATISTDATGAKTFDELALKLPTPPAGTRHPLALANGRLTVDDALLAGRRVGTAWWQGHTLPARAGERGVGVTRFVPGRDGPGSTDDLDALADEMKATGVARLEHHWGLWYDRRRDDHQMLRRMDGDVWPPFYEQPWARSGQGTAWDGLSKYDLTKFNPWYFARLKRFAEACERTGRVLACQMYFQHNILEAGAHWADFPWRPANCVQATGFPEPPEYVGGKRVFMAEAFYDVTHPVRRDLHRRYIRHCLDVLGHCPNVVFQTGEEFTGPLPFVQFWLDTVAEWQAETRKKVLVGLSCTKDVQDAILADDKRAAVVSVIDLKYWWSTPDGSVYDPKGGANLAPRQHLREWKGAKSVSAASVARAVQEYRSKHPDKAVTVSLDGHFGADFGWAVLAAGGSLPELPAATDPELLAAVRTMKPLAGALGLADAGAKYLAYTAGLAVELELPAGEFSAAWLDLKTGRPGVSAAVSGKVSLTPPTKGPAVVWVVRK